MSQNAAPIAQINVTPLVDVLLVLLIIFMITAPTLTQRLLLSLPQPMENPPPPPTAMKRRGARCRNSSGGFDADDAVAYAHIVDVLGTLKNEGLTRVSFKTHGN